YLTEIGGNVRQHPGAIGIYPNVAVEHADSAVLIQLREGILPGAQHQHGDHANPEQVSCSGSQGCPFGCGGQGRARWRSSTIRSFVPGGSTCSVLRNSMTASRSAAGSA